jgi:Outer membrane protein beta-barrel domain
MRKLFFAAIIIACAAPFASAQTASGGDYNKYDIYAGFSHNRVDVGFNDPNQNFLQNREGFNGFEVAGTYNLSRYFGVKADYTFNRKTFNDTFSDGTLVSVRNDLHTLTGGVEVKDNAPETKIKPFAHGLVGFTNARANVTGFSGLSDSQTGFSAILGGGLDFRVSPRFDVRAIQFDYNPTRLGGTTQNNFRFGVGVVFR